MPPFQGIAAATALKKGGGVGLPSLDAFGNQQVVESHGYEAVAASQTAQVLGATGAVGDVLNTLVIVPGTSAAGAVSIKDGANTAITVFAGGGTTALTDLKPIVLSLDMISAAGAWQVTTGANVTAIGIGQFT